MPWKALPMSQLRLAFAHAVRTTNVPVAQAARRFGVSRKTAYKWLDRFDAAQLHVVQVDAAPADATASLEDRSRRLARSPRRTDATLEQLILDARDRYGWGGRKLHAYLSAAGHRLPSARTTHAILARNDRIGPPPADPAPCQHFERPEPHDLWQADHKGPVEVARRDHFPLVVLDDHSRFCLALHDCIDKTMARVWNVLWQAFDEFGLPRAFLSDNAFGTTFDVPKTLSWIDAQLVLLGIAPLHGRPYHPQTQGKVERFNGTLEREALCRTVRTDCDEHFAADLHDFRDLYNHTRPHEALGDKPPVSRFAKSPRARPAKLPAADSFYPPGSELRKVGSSGDIRLDRGRILAGRGLVGQTVRIERRDNEVAVYFAWKQIRLISMDRMAQSGML
jgi:transposase InsO family protein